MPWDFVNLRSLEVLNVERNDIKAIFGECLRKMESYLLQVYFHSLSFTYSLSLV